MHVYDRMIRHFAKICYVCYLCSKEGQVRHSSGLSKEAVPSCAHYKHQSLTTDGHLHNITQQQQVVIFQRGGFDVHTLT